MDENETTTEEVKVDEKKLAPIASLFNAVLEKREAKQLASIERQVAMLAATPEDNPAVAEARKVTNERIISRYQPTDSLYRNLHRQMPQYTKVRTPDLDHWNITWLRAFLANDLVTMKMANAKACEAAGYRASTLIGALDASDPTAVLSGTGGHLLPQPFSDVVEIAREAAAVVAPLCTNFTTEGATLRVPTAAAVTADTIAEGASGAQGEPTFTSEMLVLHKLGVRMIASDEMLADSAFNLMDLYGRRAGMAIGYQEDVQILTTEGTSPDLTEALAGGNVDEASTTVLQYVDLPALFFALGKAYQPNATWLAGTVVCTLLSQLMDLNGQPVLKLPSQPPQVVTDSIPTAMGYIFGRPLYHVPATAGTLIFGDLRGYAVVRKAGGIVARMSSDVGFATDTVQFKFIERLDGRIIDDAAIKQMAALATVA